MTFMPLAFRFAIRELRGGMRGFRIFLACIVIGVSAIAGATSLNQSVKAGIQADARPLLGGDLQIDSDSYPVTDDQLAAFKQSGDVSAQIQMRSMARVETDAGDVAGRGLIELKAVERLFAGAGAGDLVMSSTKSSIGHLLGAAGAVVRASTAAEPAAHRHQVRLMA